MGKSQRTKGAVYEREVAARLSEALGRECKRKLGQARDSGNDIDAWPLIVECKRRKSLKTLYGWLAQAEAATKTIADIPVVVARADGATSLVILDLDDFLELAGSELREHRLSQVSL